MHRRRRDRARKGLLHRQSSDRGRIAWARLLVLALLPILFLALLAIAYDPNMARMVRESGELTNHAGGGRPHGSSETSPIARGPNELWTSKPTEHVGLSNGQKFSICPRRAVTCVVDGDTFWLDGVKIRIADIDTPEVRTPQCSSERALGIRATARLIDLLNAGPFELRRASGGEYDRYGRLLRVVVRDGKSIGAQLVEEGLAHTWVGHKEPWCFAGP